jgi:hypothetical protein
VENSQAEMEMAPKYWILPLSLRKGLQLKRWEIISLKNKILDKEFTMS